MINEACVIVILQNIGWQTADKGANRRANHNRYEVVLHIDRNELAAAPHAIRYYLQRDTPMVPETARRIPGNTGAIHRRARMIHGIWEIH